MTIDMNDKNKMGWAESAELWKSCKMAQAKGDKYVRLNVDTQGANAGKRTVEGADKGTSGAIRIEDALRDLGTKTLLSINKELTALDPARSAEQSGSLATVDKRVSDVVMMKQVATTIIDGTSKLAPKEVLAHFKQVETDLLKEKILQAVHDKTPIAALEMCHVLIDRVKESGISAKEAQEIVEYATRAVNQLSPTQANVHNAVEISKKIKQTPSVFKNINIIPLERALVRLSEQKERVGVPKSTDKLKDEVHTRLIQLGEVYLSPESEKETTRVVQQQINHIRSLLLTEDSATECMELAHLLLTVETTPGISNPSISQPIHDELNKFFTNYQESTSKDMDKVRQNKPNAAASKKAASIDLEELGKTIGELSNVIWGENRSMNELVKWLKKSTIEKDTELAETVEKRLKQGVEQDSEEYQEQLDMANRGLKRQAALLEACVKRSLQSQLDVAKDGIETLATVQDILRGS